MRLAWRAVRCELADFAMRDVELRITVSSFFFQAEDGIRDYKVTGVQTCALPISGPVANLVVEAVCADEPVLGRVEQVRSKYLCSAVTGLSHDPQSRLVEIVVSVDRKSVV